MLYAINELDNTISVYGHEPATGRLTARQTISTLPEGVTPTTFTADLRLTPDGRFLYGTNRGHDSIAAYAVAADGSLALVEIVPSLGKGPQNLAITPDGSLLLRLQHAAPDDASGRANWLPAPDGPFALAWRLYEPGEALLARSWLLPGVRRVG